MLKNLLLFIIICLLLIVFYLNKNEYFTSDNSSSSTITIASYNTQLNNLEDSYNKFAKNISSLSGKNDSSLNNISSLNNVNNIKTNLDLPVITKLFTEVSNNINSMYLHSTIKDPTNQNIV
jgi:ABC-type cobalt transport system substrate-binding protein